MSTISSGNRSREPMKIVIINTEYVETDAVNFKSVVQRLTGKDPTTTAAAGGGGVEPRSKGGSFSRKARLEEIRSAGGGMGCGNSSVLSRGVSFKDFDRLIMELPPFDDLFRLCAD